MGGKLGVAGVLLVALLGYLLFWPVPIEPVAWRAPAAAGYTGPYAANERLGGVRVVSVAPEIGPEHIDVGPDGRLYTAVLSGAVLRMNPDGSGIETIVNTGGRPLGFDFTANGQLVVAETGEYRIWKVDIEARGLEVSRLEPSGDPRARVIAANLPGFPDNLTRSADGRLWTGLTKPRSEVVDGMAGQPWLRAMTLRLPRFLWPVPPVYGHVIAFDEDGRVIADLQDPTGRIAETSGVTESGGRLYIHSLHAGAFGVIDATAAGLPPPPSPGEEEPETVKGVNQGH
jgi:sugar lactone lactonase YvrE